MEVFFTILISCSLLSNIWLIILAKKMVVSQKYFQAHQDQSREDADKILNYFLGFGEALRSVNEKVTSLPSQPPQSPIKPNNWDSMREAFKGPVRLDNE